MSAKAILGTGAPTTLVLDATALVQRITPHSICLVSQFRPWPSLTWSHRLQAVVVCGLQGCGCPAAKAHGTGATCLWSTHPRSGVPTLALRSDAHQPLSHRSGRSAGHAGPSRRPHLLVVHEAQGSTAGRAGGSRSRAANLAWPWSVAPRGNASGRPPASPGPVGQLSRSQPPPDVLFIARVPGDDQAGQAMPQLPWRQHRAAPPLWAAGLRIVLVSRCFTPPTGCSTIRVIDTTAWSRRLADRCGTEVVRPVGSPPAPVFAAREIP